MGIAYFDCFSGASGDMILAACIDAGVDVERLGRDLADLGVEGYRISAEKVRKQGFAATRFQVDLDPAIKPPHRHLPDIRKILDDSSLPVKIKGQAITIFERLAEAEAAVHGTSPNEVHFHEVGALDAIVDIVGACLALEQLGVDEVYASPIPTGHGTVRCAHGLMPVPAPATAELLTGVPLADCDEQGELITPTGAAILTTLASKFGPPPAMTLRHLGVGAGRREGQHRPNVLRLLLGDRADAPDGEETDEILVCQVNLDDLSGEIIGYVSEKLLDAGILDVYATPIYMKKNRPATQLTVLAEPAQRAEVEHILFTETTTFGIRSWSARRSKLSRTTEIVETEVGPIRIKIGQSAGKLTRVSPEYEDCRAAAERSGRALLEVFELARQAWSDQDRKAT